MRTNTEEEANSSSSEGLNSKKCTKKHTKYATSNLHLNDTPSVDFCIQTNIKFITDKKMKICFLLNVVIIIICIITSFTIIYRLYTQLLQVQSEIIILNSRMKFLTENCEQLKYQTHQPEENVSLNEVREEARVLQENGLESKDGNYELMLTNSREATLLSRLRRANRRSKEKTSMRKVKSSGALAAHFKGSVPEIFLKDEGLVGPWYLDNSVSRQYKFPKFHLTEGQCSIEVTEPALYLIYAQVYYITSNTLNSYSVYVRSEGSSENNIIAKCSTVGPNGFHSSEISCYTATVYSLKANDRIFIQQTEKNRTIILRDGHSFFGLVRLNNSHRNQKI